MNKELLNYLRHLSEEDIKSLSQRALKTCEEVGELARVVLPYDGAYATNHRFATREDILEEAVDTVFCALSVAHALQFTDEEIEDMMWLKAEKWARLQHNEKNLKYPVPFEIHITVELDPMIEDSERFKTTCAEANVKPLDLVTQTRTIKDVMTSSKHFGDNRSAYEEMKRITGRLMAAGFMVVREKIETVSWHPAAPQHIGDGSKMPENCYFESHIPVRLHPNDMDILTRRCKEMDLHLSRNGFKTHEDGDVTYMATYRVYEGTNEQFRAYVDQAVQYLDAQEYIVGKPMNEFSVYDTKVSHDAKWLTGN